MQFSIILVPLIWVLAPKAAGSGLSMRIRAKWAALFIALFAFTIAPALPVPSRSNLYPYLPSIFVAGAMAALMGYKHEAPQFGLTRRKLLLAVSLLVLIAAPISWIRGFNAYLRHGHTLAWANAIEHESARHGVRSICIQNGTAQDSAQAVDPLEWHFLRQALDLKRVAVSVYTTEECMHTNCIVFGLARNSGGYLAGDLVFIGAKTGEPSAAAYGLRPAAEP